MTIIKVQNDFTHGQFDPRLKNRFDLEIYSKGANILQNVFVINQGGAKRRPGTDFVDEAVTNNTNFSLRDFNFSADEKYLLVFTSGLVRIYETPSGILLTAFSVPYIGIQARQVKVAQEQNRMMLFHDDHAPRQLSRDATDPSVWVLESLPINSFPAHDFDKNYFTSGFTLSSLVQGPATLEVVSGPFVFTAAYVGGEFFGPGTSVIDPAGYARITAFISPTQVTVDIVSEFNTSLTGGILASAGLTLAEPAWSAARGWPTSGTIYQGRLVIGGSKSLTATLFFSAIDGFSDYATGAARANGPITDTLSGTRFGKILNVESDRTLQIFTENAEFAPLQLPSSPLTPDTLSVTRQSSRGSTNVEPVLLDNRTLYVAKGAKSVQSFEFDENSRAYKSVSASLISGNLIRNPVDSAILSGSTRDDSDFYFLINDDGTLAVYQTRLVEQVSAWSLCLTDGKFQGATQVGNDMYLMVSRVIEGIEKFYIEKFNFEGFLDSAINYTFVTPTATLTGLDHLEGREVRVRGDDFVLTSQTVLGGQITVKDDQGMDLPVTTAQVGLNYIPIIQTLPIVIEDKKLGIVAYTPRRLVRIFIDFFESVGILIQTPTPQSPEEVVIPYRTLGDDVLDQPIQPQTGVRVFQNIGWSNAPTVTITQKDPLPMTILGIGYGVGL